MRASRGFLSIIAMSFLFALLAPGLPGGAPSVFAGGDSFKKDEILVKLKKNAPATGPGIIAALAVERARRILSGRGEDRVYTLNLAPGETVESELTAASMSPDVEFAQPNYIYHALEKPDDPLFKFQWGLLDTGQKVVSTHGKRGADIKMPFAWNRATGSRDIVVAVIDSGVDYTHPDLADNLWTNPSPGSQGYPDDIHGINAITGTGDPLDDVGHGSHVSGIIGAAGDNAAGICGVNWHVSIMALKFLSPDPMYGATGNTEDAVACINYAVNEKQAGVDVRVINASWGGPSGDPLLQAAIQTASDNGILFVAAAGNSGTDNDTVPMYPSSFTNISGVISVAATDMHDKLAGFSDYGQSSVHVAAPGVNILSTWPASFTGDGASYMVESGTSMAAPHVAGLAALTASVNKSLTAMQIKSLILDNADFLKLPLITGGRINAARTIGAAEGDNVQLTVTRQGNYSVMQATVFAEDQTQLRKKVFFYRDGKKVCYRLTGGTKSATPGTAVLKLRDRTGNHSAFAVSAHFGDVESMSSNIVYYTVP
jgi:subtilisin family serine protease